jgi:PII-like signaling protein
MISEEALRLTVYFGERDRPAPAERGLLADTLIELYARHAVRTSVLLRGIEGFGIKHRLATEQLLTLSEDLPLLALAVDTPARIDAVLAELRSLALHGAITLERARLLNADARASALSPGSEATKLTIYLGRQQRAGGQLAHLAAVDCLHRHRVAGASVLLGLDGIVHGTRTRARFLARNTRVPLMVQSVGESPTIAAAVEELAELLSEPTMTVERVRVCKRDGALLSEPLKAPAADAAGLAYWQKLVVYTSERTRYGREPLHAALVRRLRREGAAGATSLRGQWGYHGEHVPHGEAFWSIRRHVPVLTLVMDTPENALRWFAIVDEMTHESGLVTSELVPALRAAGPEIAHGGVRLAARHEHSPG